MQISRYEQTGVTRKHRKEAERTPPGRVDAISKTVTCYRRVKVARVVVVAARVLLSSHHHPATHSRLTFALVQAAALVRA